MLHAAADGTSECASALRPAVLGQAGDHLMPWVKLSDTFAEDPRLERAGTEAFVLHVAALCYCNRNQTDGRLSAATARRLWALDDTEAVVEALVREEVWARVSTGELVILNYLDDQPSAAKVREDRAKKKVRQDKWLSKVRGGDTSGDASLDASGDGAPPRPAPPRRKAGAGTDDHSASAAPVAVPEGEAGDPLASSVRVGSRVGHQAFGEGVVTAVMHGESPGKRKLDVDFEHAGTKRLLVPNRSTWMVSQ